MIATPNRRDSTSDTHEGQKLTPNPFAVVSTQPILVIAILETRWWRLKLDLDLLEVALAVRLYRLENGRYPARISDIPKRWLPAVPTDPWGQPIAYRLKNGRPLIYNFGPDGRDDGGRPADPRQLSASTRGDLVWGSLAQPRH